MSTWFDLILGIVIGYSIGLILSYFGDKSRKRRKTLKDIEKVVSNLERAAEAISKINSPAKKKGEDKIIYYGGGGGFA